MSDIQSPDIPTRTRRVYPLKDLGVARENLRFDQPADDGIPLLAATLKAAGQLQPLTVRPGRRKEKPAMALDGRRRLLAFELLLAEGEIGEDHPVEVFEETDPARQAAAALLTNTAVPVHVADVIAAIGKSLKARLTPAAIAGALGYAEVEIRRLAALSGLHPTALQALKAGKLNLRQAKLLARLPDRDDQAEIAERMLQGYAFPEHRVGDALDAGRVIGTDPRCALVGAARYAAAGGRIEADLFGERPEVWLDPEALDRAWLTRAAELAGRLGFETLTVQVTVEPVSEAREDLEPIGNPYAYELQGEARETWRKAALAEDVARSALAGQDLADAASDAAILALLQARVARDLASEPGRTASLLMLRPGAATGIEVRAYGSPAPELEAEADLLSEAGASPEAAGVGRPAAPMSAVETQGVNHALHEVRTDAATRALIRGLADDPAAALVALVARLFDLLVLREGRGPGGGALNLTAEAYSRPRSRVIEPLDGVVRQRLADRRTAWGASDQTVIGWVAGLAAEDRMALLAELTALSLDLREERTTSIRHRARAEAAELAALCGLEVTLWWTPDEPFLRAHSKGQLLGLLKDMDAGDAGAGGLKKDPLVTMVAGQAAERRWAPAWLSWRSAPDMAEALAVEAEAAETDAAPEPEAVDQAA